VAQSEHAEAADQCPLLVLKRTSRGLIAMSAFDPSRTLALPAVSAALFLPRPEALPQRYLSPQIHF